MLLLIKKDCPFCEELEELHRKFPEIKKFYWEDGFVLMEEHKLPLDKKIPGLPALITNDTVYAGKKYITDFLKNYKQE